MVTSVFIVSFRARFLSCVPQGWPLPAETEVWVMTSTSGAAAMTTVARFAPYQELAERFRQIPWPSNREVNCSQPHGLLSC